MTHSVASIVQAIKSPGYYIIPNYWDKQKCAQARAEIDAFLASNPEKIWTDAIRSDKRIFGFDKKSQIAQAFYNDPLVNGVYEQLVGPTRNGFILAGKIDFVPGNRGSGQGWHRDDANGDQFKAFLYLSNVTMSNGPLQYIPDSFTKWQKFKLRLRFGLKSTQDRFEGVREEASIEKLKSNIFVAQEGTLIIANVSAIHRGMPIKEGSRYALTNYMWHKQTIPDHIQKLLI